MITALLRQFFLDDYHTLWVKWYLSLDLVDLSCMALSMMLSEDDEPAWEPDCHWRWAFYVSLDFSFAFLLHVGMPLDAPWALSVGEKWRFFFKIEKPFLYSASICIVFLPFWKTIFLFWTVSSLRQMPLISERMLVGQNTLLYHFCAMYSSWVWVGYCIVHKSLWMNIH